MWIHNIHETAAVRQFISPDNRCMNLKERCPDDVKKMLIIWSRDNVGEAGPRGTSTAS